MTCKESIKWLENLKNELGQSQYQGLWHYEQALAETIELLNYCKATGLLNCLVKLAIKYITYQ